MWKIKHIFDGEYGCEERIGDQKPKVSVTIVNNNDEKVILTLQPQWFRDNNLDEGAEWPLEVEGNVGLD